MRAVLPGQTGRNLPWWRGLADSCTTTLSKKGIKGAVRILLTSSEMRGLDSPPIRSVMRILPIWMPRSIISSAPSASSS